MRKSKLVDRKMGIEGYKEVVWIECDRCGTTKPDVVLEFAGWINPYADHWICPSCIDRDNSWEMRQYESAVYRVLRKMRGENQLARRQIDDLWWKTEENGKVIRAIKRMIKDEGLSVNDGLRESEVKYRDVE